jgi:phytoene desaturase
MPKKAVIIGGGVGGLSAAIHLARRGLQVTLLEKNAALGGKLNLWAVQPPKSRTDGVFKFDTGPSLLTLPLVFQDLFAAAGEDVRDYLAIQKLDPISRFCWSDGTTFSLRAGADDRMSEIHRIAPHDVDGFRRLYAHGELVWNLSADAFVFHSPQQMLRRAGFSPSAMLKMLTTPLRIGVFGNYAKLVDRHIQSEKLRQVMYQYMTYTGSSPNFAPATLAVIPYVEMEFGAWYIAGGMYKLAEALQMVARKMGIEIRTQTQVSQILVEHSQARGVRTNANETIDADVVVANCDLVYAYRNLIDARHRPRFTDERLNQIDPGSSAAVLMLGIEGSYPQLAHHNKFMAEGADDADIYVCAPTRSDGSLAPADCETLFVCTMSPPLNGSIDWPTEARAHRDRVIQALETKWGLTDLSKRIVVERMITPLDLKAIYNANAGSIYGISSNTRRGAFLRPPNRDRDIAGLYFAGGATHPGGGLPMVALSGKIAAELVAEDLDLH